MTIKRIKLNIKKNLFLLTLISCFLMGCQKELLVEDNYSIIENNNGDTTHNPVVPIEIPFAWYGNRKMPVKYFLRNINPMYITADEFKYAFELASSNWAAQTPFEFKPVYMFDSSDIVVDCFQVEPFAGWAGTLVVDAKRYKYIAIDNATHWVYGNTFNLNEFDLVHILMHELGHNFNLRDLPLSGYSLMQGVLRNGLRTLQIQDLIAFQSVYQLPNYTKINTSTIHWESISKNTYNDTTITVENNGKLISYIELINAFEDYSIVQTAPKTPIYPNNSNEYVLTINKSNAGDFCDTLKFIIYPFIQDTIEVYSLGTVMGSEVLG